MLNGHFVLFVDIFSTNNQKVIMTDESLIIIIQTALVNPSLTLCTSCGLALYQVVFQIKDTDLLHHNFLSQDVSESPGAFFGIIAYKGLSCHPV